MKELITIPIVGKSCFSAPSEEDHQAGEVAPQVRLVELGDVPRRLGLLVCPQNTWR